VLARYSPEFPCLTAGLVEAERRTAETFATGRLHVLVEITNHQGRYEKGVDEPPSPEEGSLIDQVGPQCYGLPNPPVPFPPAEPPGTGYDFDHPRSPIQILPGVLGRAADESMLIDPTMGYAGSEEEKALVKPIVAM